MVYLTVTMLFNQLLLEKFNMFETSTFYFAVLLIYLFQFPPSNQLLYHLRNKKFI